MHVHGSRENSQTNYKQETRNKLTGQPHFGNYIQEPESIYCYPAEIFEKEKQHLGRTFDYIYGRKLTAVRYIIEERLG